MAVVGAVSGRGVGCLDDDAVQIGVVYHQMCRWTVGNGCIAETFSPFQKTPAIVNIWNADTRDSSGLSAFQHRFRGLATDGIVRF